jgi:hypothetical protein
MPSIVASGIIYPGGEPTQQSQSEYSWKKAFAHCDR